MLVIEVFEGIKVTFKGKRVELVKGKVMVVFKAGSAV